MEKSQAKGQEGVIGLTPEHLEHIKRIAQATKRTPEQVLADAVTVYWIRFACNAGLKQGEW